MQLSYAARKILSLHRQGKCSPKRFSMSRGLPQAVWEPRDFCTQVSAQAGGPPAEARRGRRMRRMGVVRDVKRIFFLSLTFVWLRVWCGN